MDTNNACNTHNALTNKISSSINGYINYKYSEFLNSNPEIEVSFPQHTYCVNIIDPMQQ